MNSSEKTPLTPEQKAERIKELLAALSATKVAPKAKAPAGKKAPSEGLICNSLAERFAIESTGYKVWRAIGIVTILEQRNCSCGSSHLEWRDEMFELENGLSKSIWRRHEGYGIEHQEDLPRRVEIWPATKEIKGCKDCMSVDAIDMILGRLDQMSFPF